MRERTLVKIPSKGRRFWVAFNVTARDIKRGMFANKPGMHLFAGYWNPKRRKFGHHAFGKLIELPSHYKIVGYVRNPEILHKLS